VTPANTPLPEAHLTINRTSQKTINRPSTDHQQTINRPSTDHQQTINRPSTDHQQTINRPSANHHKRPSTQTINRPSTELGSTVFGPPESGSVRKMQGTDLDPSIMKHSKKNLDFYCFVTSL
jgi:hypothetical protein